MGLRGGLEVEVEKGLEEDNDLVQILLGFKA